MLLRIVAASSESCDSLFWEEKNDSGLTVGTVLPTVFTHSEEWLQNCLDL